MSIIGVSIMGDKGRGFGTGSHFKKYKYTTQDVADTTGRSIGTVRNDIRDQKLDMESLWSVSMYVAKYWSERPGHDY